MVTNKDIQALNEFLENRNVNYVLTGTAALFYHGMLPENTDVHDIDIIVITSNETRLRSWKISQAVNLIMNITAREFLCSRLVKAMLRSMCLSVILTRNLILSTRQS